MHDDHAGYGKTVNPIETTALPDTGTRSAMPKLTLDPDRYREHLDEFDLTREQQDELLQVLWDIMSTLVDISWGVDTVQMFLPDLFEKTGVDSGKLLEPNNACTFNHNAACTAAGKESNDET